MRISKRRLRAAELPRIYRDLKKHFGHQNWWPGETPFEVMVGAILTQNTAWVNVEKAIANLKKAGKLTPQALRTLSTPKLARLIRPAGYFNVKARRLKNFIDFLFSEYGGRPEKMFKEDGAILRQKLLSVNGIGPETADSILLYAAGKPFFVIDAYTKRIFARHGLLQFEKDYHDWQKFFAEALPRSVPLFNDFHAQIVALGKDHCRPTARCQSCPLESYL